MMEELLEKAWRYVPLGISRILTYCAVTGYFIGTLISVFQPLVQSHLQGVLDPEALTFARLSALSLLIVGPAYVIYWYRDPGRAQAQAVLRQIDVIEAAMDRVDLKEHERVTVRRGLIKALADEIKRNIGGNLTVDLASAANREVPGLIETKREAS